MVMRCLKVILRTRIEVSDRVLRLMEGVLARKGLKKESMQATKIRVSI